MELKDLAAVSGKGGLYRVVSPIKSGVVLESLDETKTKLVASSNQKISILSEISMYTTTKDGSVALLDVLLLVRDKFKDELGVHSESDSNKLKEFMKVVLPEYDETRVYTSDIKKLVKWYGMIQKFAPEVLETKSAEEKPTEEPAK